MGRLIALLSTLSGLGMGWYAIVRGAVAGVDAVILILAIIGTAAAAKTASKYVETRK